MNRYTRPRYAKKDENHTPIFHDLAKMVGGWLQIEDAEGNKHQAYTGLLMGLPFLIIDRSQAGGLNLDTTLYIRSGIRDIEIKMPGCRGDLTPGEKMYFEITPKTGRIATSAEEYYQHMVDLFQEVSDG